MATASIVSHPGATHLIGIDHAVAAAWRHRGEQAGRAARLLAQGLGFAALTYAILAGPVLLP